MRNLPLSIVILISCLLLVPRGLLQAQDAPDAPGVQPYIALAESEPVKIGSLEFVVAVQKEWPLFPGREISLQVQLYIINHGKKDVLFPTFDTFGVSMADANGKEIQMSGGRDGTMFAKPVLVPAGGHYCLCRSATMKCETDGKNLTFDYEDGTGSWAACELSAGDYTLRFYVENSTKDPPGIKSNGVLIPLWKGKGETKEAKFKVIDVKQ